MAFLALSSADSSSAAVIGAVECGASSFLTSSTTVRTRRVSFFFAGMVLFYSFLRILSKEGIKQDSIDSRFAE
jgi:hypothetical protein